MEGVAASHGEPRFEVRPEHRHLRSLRHRLEFLCGSRSRESRQRHRYAVQGGQEQFRASCRNLVGRDGRRTHRHSQRIRAHVRSAGLQDAALAQHDMERPRRPVGIVHQSRSEQLLREPERPGGPCAG